MEKVGVDIYLDLYDVELKEAVSVDNDRKIVESIKMGIATSSHLLCLVSHQTRLSWWVPYEVGVAGEHNKEIGITDIPSFLKTEKVLNTIQEFFDYTKTLGRYGGLFSTRVLKQDDKTTLCSYIDF